MGGVYAEHITTHSLVVLHGGITVDLFADHTSAKVARFYSRHWCPGTLGVNSYNHPWATDPATGSRELGYANRDFNRMGDTLAKIKAEHADGVVVYPDWPRYWQVLWRNLPVQDVVTLPKTA